MKKNTAGILFASVGIAVGVLAGALSFSATAKAAGTNRILSNVYIDDVNVSGMEADKALELIRDHVAGYEDTIFTLSTIEDMSVSFSAADLRMTANIEEAVNAAASYGRKGGPLSRYIAEQKASAGEEFRVPLKYSIDKDVAMQLLLMNRDQVTREAIDYAIERVDGSFNIIEGQTGVGIKPDESIERLATFIALDWEGGDSEIALVTEVTEPIGSNGELSMITDVLGSFSTTYNARYETYHDGRCYNIEHATELIDGAILFPGDIFSVYQAIGPIDESAGYQLAGAYENGKVVQEPGGGVCQVSSTLYNACLLAELATETRSCHSMIVTYVEPSADAAIAGDYKDYQFVNSTDYPIYIEGYTDKGKVYFNVFGHETRPEGHKVEYVSEILEEVPCAVTFEVTGEQPVGYVNVINGHTGYKARLMKITYENGVEVERKQQNKSTYNMSPRSYVIGTAGADPTWAAMINAYAAAGDEAGVRAMLGM